jgi:hypothetical protein
MISACPEGLIMPNGPSLDPEEAVGRGGSDGREVPGPEPDTSEGSGEAASVATASLEGNVVSDGPPLNQEGALGGGDGDGGEVPEAELSANEGSGEGAPTTTASTGGLVAPDGPRSIADEGDVTPQAQGAEGLGQTHGEGSGEDAPGAIDTTGLPAVAEGSIAHEGPVVDAADAGGEGHGAGGATQAPGGENQGAGQGHGGGDVPGPALDGSQEAGDVDAGETAAPGGLPAALTSGWDAPGKWS